jgi:hypothetical protein
MHEWAPQLTRERISWASTLWLGFLFLAIVLSDARPASALPLVTAKAHSLPAFAAQIWDALLVLP